MNQDNTSCYPTYAWWLDPKFSTSQSQIENSVKCMKILASFRKNVWVMQNLRLGIQSDKIWADSTTQSTLKYLAIYSADMPNWPRYLGYLKKTLIGCL